MPGGAAMFVNEFNTAYNDEPQVIIGGTLPTPQSELTEKLKTYKINRHLELKDNPFFSDKLFIIFSNEFDFK